MEQPDAWRMTERVSHELGRGDPFAAAVRATRMPMIITDPRQDDNPIVFANDAFLDLTGYERDEIVGRNCRFLQGLDTDRRAVDRIREAVETGNDVTIDLLNYRKDGTSFWNALYVSPVVSSEGELQFFFASQLDVTERRDALAVKTALLHEVDHRVKNNLQMIVALLALHAKNIADPDTRSSLTTLIARVDAVSTVHRRLFQSDDVTRFSVDEFVRDIVTDLAAVSGRENVEVRLDIESVTVPAEKASAIALMVNELVTNAIKHALSPVRPGVLAITAKRDGERLRVEITDDGGGMPPQLVGTNKSFGLKLIRMLARQLGAVVTWSAVEPSGTCAAIDLPIEQLAPGA